MNTRIYMDMHSLYPDHAHADYPAFGSQLLDGNSNDGFSWRRNYVMFSAKVQRFSFRLDNNYAVKTPFPHSLREVWIATQIGPGELTVGQFKAYRGMEELTSASDITFSERPSTSSSGMYSGRQFQTGIGYRAVVKDNLRVGVNVMSLSHLGLPLEGVTYGGRVYWLPINQANNTLHLGFSVSRDTSNRDSLPAKVTDVYGGFSGFKLSLGTAGAAPVAPDHNSQSTFSTEAAYAFKSLTLQSEYAISKLDNTHQTTTGALKDSLIHAYYVQASWFLTGEQTIYSKDRGVFRKPQPMGKWGALELVGRYDFAENSSQNLMENPCKTGTSKCQSEVLSLGMNWYPHPNIRFMANYSIAEAMLGNAGNNTPVRRDHLSIFSFRTQIIF
ncbi:phosphate-selective porin OprO and OprP [Nitrosomonas sp. PY1]|uniref:OprO/OprP family phosphate-selective porin n=1 Tax=Nitrosomonas sp. PY1 TaxID=1803906 RepID=UPI001FC80574|nr:porin [Nitrosomonas sp. PY1]GKS69929.1 phosphate-selective porin OprO and OprP [Nitrosomonas sp. PY1]